MEQSYTVQGIAFLSPPLIFFGNFDLFCPSVETLYIYIYEWRSEFPVSRVVWTKKSWNWKVDFTFWLWDGPQLNDALHKLGAIASVALVKLWYAERCAINMQRVVWKPFLKSFIVVVLQPFLFSIWVTRNPMLLQRSQKGEMQSEFCARAALRASRNLIWSPWRATWPTRLTCIDQAQPPSAKKSDRIQQSFQLCR